MTEPYRVRIGDAHKLPEPEDELPTKTAAFDRARELSRTHSGDTVTVFETPPEPGTYRGHPIAEFVDGDSATPVV